jgi:hypothetical protein
MFMAKTLGFPDILQKPLMVSETVFFVVHRELPPHENIIGPSWKMYTVPGL